MVALPQPGQMYEIGYQLLDCVCTTLEATVTGCPDRRCIVPGAELPWDNCRCGMVAVQIPRSYPSDRFPEQKIAGPFMSCATPFTVVEYVVTVLRCVPGNDDQGNPPSCDQLDAAAQIDLDDRQATWQGVACCLDARYHLITEQLAVGDQGGCAGSELHVLVALANCNACPEGI